MYLYLNVVEKLFMFLEGIRFFKFDLLLIRNFNVGNKILISNIVVKIICDWFFCLFWIENVKK